jgi:hypothetical protein
MQFYCSAFLLNINSSVPSGLVGCVYLVTPNFIGGYSRYLPYGRVETRELITLSPLRESRNTRINNL